MVGFCSHPLTLTRQHCSTLSPSIWISHRRGAAPLPFSAPLRGYAVVPCCSISATFLLIHPHSHSAIPQGRARAALAQAHNLDGQGTRHPQIPNGKTQEVTIETKHEFVLYISIYRIENMNLGMDYFLCRDQWLNFSKKFIHFSKERGMN
jgi:hypothetical protein